MWKGRFAIKHDCAILEGTKKFNVISSGYVLNSYEEEGEKYHSIWHSVEGEEAQEFLQSLAKHKDAIHMEVQGNIFFGIFRGEFIAQKYSKKLFFLGPIVHKKDTEVWTLGSARRKDLIHFFDQVKQIANIEIKEIREIGIPVLLHSFVPRMTLKQQSSWSYACRNGYYSFPRKTSVVKMSKDLKLNRSTFQEHLRKAEEKIMNNTTPFLFDEQ